MSDDARTKVRWEHGVPISEWYDDPYYSRENGLAESRHVFLSGNDLPDRFPNAPSFAIAELGFGTGLNMIAALDLWRKCGTGRLTYTAFEAAPMQPAQMVKAASKWPEISDLAAEVATAWADNGLCLTDIEVTVIIGDARQTLPAWHGSADAWFLDGFAPSRNPEMWQADLLGHVHERTRAGGSFASYTAAGHVRRNLQAAGFRVERRPGYGRKREMIAGYKPSPHQA